MPQLPPIPARIEDYALLSDCTTAALVSRAGSIDWLCWPRFDSPACLSALLGDERNGRWQICPAEPEVTIERAYRDGTLVLETVFTTPSGSAALIDFMPFDPLAPAGHSRVVRILQGRTGTLAMRMALKLRFGYGIAVPWVTRLEDADGEGIVAIAGPDLVVLRCAVPIVGRDLETVAEFTIAPGQSLQFTLAYGASHQATPPAVDGQAALHRTEAAWQAWSGRCTADGPYAAAIRRSLITLKALTYAPTGGIVAAPTTSLPETPGGSRNWDYRYCWLRDSTLTLIALMDGGYYDEAQAWIGWLHRAIAGSAEQLQIMYGIAGERRLDEWQADWLPGYQGARPVRIGNEAAGQVQLDVFGEVMGSMRLARQGGLVLPAEAWSLQVNLLAYLTTLWREPDRGMWEVRGPPRAFTFSRVAAWAAFNAAILDAQEYSLPAPLDDWLAERDAIHAEVCAQGFSTARNSFTQSYGSDRLDASLLLIPITGFLPADDPRVLGTVAAIERELTTDGLVRRYEPDPELDGQAGTEGAFLACSFWLVSVLAMQGRLDEARTLFDRLLTLVNDVGLLAEEYDPASRRQLGNFPQAFSHLAMVISANALRGHGGT